MSQFTWGPTTKEFCDEKNVFENNKKRFEWEAAKRYEKLMINMFYGAFFILLIFLHATLRFWYIEAVLNDSFLEVFNIVNNKYKCLWSFRTNTNFVFDKHNWDHFLKQAKRPNKYFHSNCSSGICKKVFRDLKDLFSIVPKSFVTNKCQPSLQKEPFIP